MSETEPSGPRFLIVGCGAIGGVVGAHLADLGCDVTALTTNEHIAEALETHGFRVRGDETPGPVRPAAVVRELPSDTEPFDFVLLATQPPQVEDAARTAAPHLKPDGRVVCFQNGLCEERVAPLVGGEQRVIGAVVAWGASMVEPGQYDRTSAGGFSIGTLSGEKGHRVDELARVFESIGPVTVTENLRGARWSKLAINCAISTLGTIGGDRLGALMRYRFVRRAALDIMTEVVDVARAENIRLELVSGTLDLDWIALTESEQSASGSPGLVAKHGLLLAVGARYRRLRSSMLAAIERGRPPAVDFLNGEIVDRARRHGIAVPVNELARETVWRIARGEQQPSVETLRSVYDRTRSASA